MSDAPLAADLRPWRDASARPFLRVDRVTKRFGAAVAVDDVSLDVYQGELFCLLGGSGCGKSTLLRMIGGFETPSAGRIEIDGQDMTDVPPYARPVNMMFQSYALFPHMSVARNIGYGLRRDGLPRAELAARVEEMLGITRLGDFADRKPHQLSGGQRQRVALARALAKRPKVLLLDEPLGALDKKLREETQFELVKLQESLGVTFVVVTHDQEEAMTLATRIGVMDAGYIAQVGEPREVYEFPNSRFVAGFVGSANMFEGAVTETGSDHAIVRAAQGFDIRLDGGMNAAIGQQVAVAVRPEKITLTRERPDGTENAVAGMVEEIAYLGDVSIYRITLEGGMRALATRANTARRDDGIGWDERVWLSWDASACVGLTA